MIYLRFVCQPQDMWEWFEAYLPDDCAIPISSTSSLPMGHLVKHLIEEQKFSDVLLPRIPALLHRTMKEKLAQHTRELPPLPEAPRELSSERRDSRSSGSTHSYRPRYESNRYRSRSRSPPYRRPRSPDRYSRDRYRDDRYDDRRGSDRYEDRHRDDRHRDERHSDRRRDSYERRAPSSRDRRSPSPVPRQKTPDAKPAADSAQLAKLKALYGDSAPSSKSSSVGSYGDSLGDDVVRIGFQ